MSQILRDLNKLALKVGAPVVGKNISEQVRALSTFWEGTSHGANIAERVNELAHSEIGKSEPPALVEKTITENGTYDASDDEADGYSEVTVNVLPALPEDLELYGVMNSSWWWHNAPSPKGDYLWRVEDAGGSAPARASLRSGMLVRCPKGCIVEASWDKESLLISGENVNPDGTQGDISLSWQAQPYVYDNTAGTDDAYFAFFARKSDNTNFNSNELPTKLIVTYSR